MEPELQNFAMGYRPWNKKQPVHLIAPFGKAMSPLWSIPIFLLLLFLGGIFGAKRQDPFSRKWFTLKVTDQGSIKCVAVLPKPIRQCPLIIYVHGSGGSLMDDGNDLRQMAELGLATVSLEYNQTNETEFGPEFQAVLSYIGRQTWATTTQIAWVGFSTGANRILDFALQNPGQLPQLLVQVSGTGLPNSQTNNDLKLLHCPVLLIHGGQDEIFPLDDTVRLASALQSKGLPVDLRLIPKALHDIQPDREVVFRCIGEYCLTHISCTNSWQNYHSIAEWEADAPSFWLFCIPAAAWALGCFAWTRYRKSASKEKLDLKRHEVVLRCVAAVLAASALADTTLHLLPPHFAVTDNTLSVARKYLVPPKERADFEFLANQHIWHNVKLKTLLTHAELANYNRGLINWQLDETNYLNYVLFPPITGEPIEQFSWRRPLWEEFYPRIRHENSPQEAAVIVVRHLRERVTIANIPNPSRQVPEIWLRQITDKTGFQVIYVAALRSVGVPARLNLRRQAEFFDGTEWRIAPAPAVVGL